MGAVFVKREVHDTLMQGPEGAIELFHGYTYSGHPLACAASLGTLDTYAEEGLFERAASLENYFQEAVHSLRDARHVIDIRNIGLAAAIELTPRPGAATERAMEVFRKAFDSGLLLRVTGDIIATSPPLIVSKAQIDEIVDGIRNALSTTE
jgi:beta-alanine--pyruvate transaminase